MALHKEVNDKVYSLTSDIEAACHVVSTDNINANQEKLSMLILEMVL